MGKIIRVRSKPQADGKMQTDSMSSDYIKKEKPSVLDNDSESMINQQLKNAGIQLNFPSDNNNNETTSTTTTTTNSQSIPENLTKKLLVPPSGFTDGGLSSEILLTGNKIVRISTDLKREK